MDILELVNERRIKRRSIRQVEELDFIDKLFYRHTTWDTYKEVKKIYDQMMEMGWRGDLESTNFFAAVSEYNRRFSLRRMGLDPKQTEFIRQYKQWKRNQPKFTVTEIG
jgi:hypothetical protein